MCDCVCAVHWVNLKRISFKEFKFLIVFVCVCGCLLSGPMVLVIIAVDGDTAMVGDRPRHGCHPCDDAG